MTIRSPLLAFVAFVPLALVLGSTAGCTTAYTNASLCKQKMIATYPESEPELSFDRTKMAIHGSRIVVEATYQNVVKTLVVTKEKNVETRTVKATRTAAPAAVECTFEGATLTSFRWLAPQKFAWVYDPQPPADDE